MFEEQYEPNSHVIPFEVHSSHPLTNGLQLAAPMTPHCRPRLPPLAPLRDKTCWR